MFERMLTRFRKQNKCGICDSRLETCDRKIEYYKSQIRICPEKRRYLKLKIKVLRLIEKYLKEGV